MAGLGRTYWNWGVITENDMLSLLNIYLKVPAVKTSDLNDIDSEIIASSIRELA